MVMFALAAGAGCQTTKPMAKSSPATEVWQVDRDLSARPPVWFSFPKPFDTYAGEFPRVEGELRVHDGTVEGWFRVRIMDVTLGEEELNKNVRHNMEMLAGGAHPTSTFTVRSISPWKSLADRATEDLFVGELELKGITVPIKAPAVMDFSKSGRLRLKGGFVIESLKERFAIVGPGVEGETEGDRVEVLFDVTLLRSPADNNTSRNRA